MKITMKDKLKMCKLHIDEGMSLSHISELYGNYHVSKIKYLIKLYKAHGEEPFLNPVFTRKLLCLWKQYAVLIKL